MKKNPEVTPNSTIVSGLRRMWMASRERGAAIKRDSNTCQVCGKKGSVAKGREVKTEVHHLQSGDINWERILRVLRAELYCPPNNLITLCREHHKECHEKGEL